MPKRTSFCVLIFLIMETLPFRFPDTNEVNPFLIKETLVTLADHSNASTDYILGRNHDSVLDNCGT